MACSSKVLPIKADTAVLSAEGVLGFEAFASTQPQAKMWPAGYLFGVCGVVERECVGYAEHPEGLAFRQNIPRQPLYRVRFHQQVRHPSAVLPMDRWGELVALQAVMTCVPCKAGTRPPVLLPLLVTFGRQRGPQPEPGRQLLTCVVMSSQVCYASCNHQEAGISPCCTGAIFSQLDGVEACAVSLGFGRSPG